MAFFYNQSISEIVKDVEMSFLSLFSVWQIFPEPLEIFKNNISN